jgi:hypothetical protein
LAGSSFKATFDLTEAYAGAAAKVLRKATFDPATGAAVIEDVITAPAGDTVWRIFTDAAVTISGDTVKLARKNDIVTLKRLSPDGVWSVAEARPPTAEENPNKGFRSVSLTVPKADNLTIRVGIRP